MLSFQTVFPDTLELLKVLMQQPLFDDLRLVGGTSLALQYGHRRSVDLDFFGHTTEDVDELTNMLSSCAKKVVRGNFEDADLQPMPFMFQQVGWDTIKDEIKHQVEMYNQSITCK